MAGSAIGLGLATPLWGIGMLGMLAAALGFRFIDRGWASIAYGFCLGCGVMGVYFQWIRGITDVSSLWIPNALWLGWVIYQAVFYAGAGAIMGWIPVPRWLQFPLAWMIMEWLRSIGPLGTTAANPGYLMVSVPVIRDLGYWIGSFGVGVGLWIVVFASVYGGWDRRLWGFLGAGIGIAVLASIFVPHSTGLTDRVALLEGHHSQSEKLDPQRTSVIITDYIALANRALVTRPDCILAPETIILTPVTVSGREIFPILDWTRRTHIPWILGVPVWIDGKLINGVIAVDNGKIVDFVSKNQLIPFGEYLPFRSLWTRLNIPDVTTLVDFVPGQTTRPLAFHDRLIGVGICMESANRNRYRQLTDQGSNWLVNVGNLAWFGEKSVSYWEQVALLRFRAIETRRSMVVISNTGPTGIIDPNGQIQVLGRGPGKKIITGTVVNCAN